MPFKDCDNNPIDPIHEFTPQRAIGMGEDLVDAMVDVLPYLRASFPFSEEVMLRTPEPLPPPPPLYYYTPKC